MIDPAILFLIGFALFAVSLILFMIITEVDNG